MLQRPMVDLGVEDPTNSTRSSRHFFSLATAVLRRLRWR